MSWCHSGRYLLSCLSSKLNTVFTYIMLSKKGCVLILSIAISLCEHIHGIHVNCQAIRHSDVSAHRFATCMRNIRGILRLMCSFNLQGKFVLYFFKSSKN